MAKDVPNKPVSSNNNNNNSGITSPTQVDQQKVPPLRIVLNTSGNQKGQSTATTGTTTSTTTATASNQQPQPQTSDLKREKPPDSNGETRGGAVKPGGKVRIRLGTNKQQAASKGASDTSTNNSSKTTNESSKGESNSSFKEEINASFGHLRRITRRSHRTVQTVNNEDEESISSMTSTDENQNTTNNNSSDNTNSGQDTAGGATSSGNSQSGSSSTTTAETPQRRYKRRKGDTNGSGEGLLSDQSGAFGFQNYLLPVQNSFELFKNIRKQVDKKLDELSHVHPKSPRGFRDYMLARGAYLLHGNRLGNGTNLYMNEDGGLHVAPMSKFHALKQYRVHYSVPNQAKVPLGLPINSPLYDLFREQEKERYRMRMQHIKEREKLTLAAEQEIMRVYNQAALAAADQVEPFSACTMLKHQEIYNYMDSDGFMIQSSEEDQQDQQAKQDGVRTRRRQHEQIASPPSNKKESTSDHPQANETNAKEQSKQSSPDANSTGESQKDDNKARATASSSSTTTTATAQQPVTTPEESSDKEKGASGESDTVDSANNDVKSDLKVKEEKETKVKDEPGPGKDKQEGDGPLKEKTTAEVTSGGHDNPAPSPKHENATRNDETAAATAAESKVAEQQQPENDKKGCSSLVDMEVDEEKASKGEGEPAETNATAKVGDGTGAASTDEADGGDGSRQDAKDGGEEPVLTDAIRRAYNKRIFLSQLQQIDDKWDKIRGEMLIRHRNEAESLHAVQRLEWEWKTKEIGACDVRTTPVIDNTLVPKLNIYSQDY